MKFTSATMLIIASLAAQVSAAAIALDDRQAQDGPDTTLKRALPAPSPMALSVRNNDDLPTLDIRQSQSVDSTHPDRESAQNALDDNRAEGRRKLSATTAKCKNADCHSCMSASTVTALAEVAGCGIVAAATEVGTAGAATAFVVAGFIACETAITGTMAKSVIECESYNP